MSPERLLEHFEQISEAPDAIPHLRRFILDLAVRGKLVDQDPKDEPAAELLMRIQAERSRLEDKGVMRPPKPATPIADTEILFPIPESWKWVRLAEVGSVVGGGTPPSKDDSCFTTGGKGIAWLTPADLGKHDSLYVAHGARDLTEKGIKESSAQLMPPGSVLFTSRAPIGYTAIARNSIATNQGFKSVVPFVMESNRYIATYFRAFAPWIDGKASGTTFKEVSGKIVANLPFPLPPLAEQHRIVAKVDDLMKMCDKLEVSQAKRERRRDRLVAATLYGLNNGVKDENSDEYLSFEESTRFYFNHLPRLTTRPGHIHQLRQTILNLAVRGKLVPQDPKDDPASELLKRIEKERERLLNAGDPNEAEARTQLRKQYQQTIPDNVAALPHGWAWATLLQCSHIVVDCHNKTAPYVSSGTLLLRTSNIRNGKLVLDDVRFVNDKTYARWSLRCEPTAGDILITREAPMGEVAQIPTGLNVCMGQRLMLIRLIKNSIDPDYLLYSLRDPFLMKRVQDKPVGATVQHLRVGGVETLLVPVPPLAEQHRIVVRVDQLMRLCDELEHRITAATDTRRRFLESTLQQALAS